MPDAIKVSQEALREQQTAPIRRRWSSRQLRCATQALILSLAGFLAACGGGAGLVEEPLSSGLDAEGRAQKLSSPAASSSVQQASVTYSTVVLRAQGTVVNGVGAFVQLRYNGLVIAEAEITSLNNYVFRVPVTFNGGFLDLVFKNATPLNATPARHFRIGSVSVNGTTFFTTSPGVVIDLGHGLQAFDGISARPGASVLSEMGAMRFPLPSSSRIGPPTQGTADQLAAPPGPHVSASAGSDLNPGTRARPYRSLAALVGRTLLPGENIHLRCGDLWRETLALGVSELSDGTEIRSYGDDCATKGKPTIVGANLFNGGWTRNGNVWSRSLPAGTPQITRLSVGGTALRPAQWPNADAAPAVVAGSVVGQPARFILSTSAATALVGRDLSGATALLQTKPWLVERHQVAPRGLSGNIATLTAAPKHAAKGGDTYIFRDQAWMLDAPGEYFHDVAGQRLHFIPPATGAWTDINSTQVEGSIRDMAIDLRGRSRIAVSDIAVRGARADGFRLTDTPQARLSSIEARDNGASGVRLWQWEPLPESSPGPTVENSLVVGNGDHGIDATFVRKATIKGNQVRDTGLGVFTENTLAAISAGPGGRVEDNIVDGSAYIGIRFSSVGGSVVSRNTVSGYCRRLTDCGAIYTWTGRESPAEPQLANVEENKVTPVSSAVPINATSGYGIIAGIYVDDFSRNTIVRSNQLAGMPVGILVHNSSNIAIESNDVWLVTAVGVWATMDQLDADWARGNTFRNNRIVPVVQADTATGQLPKFTTAQAFWFWHSRDGEAALAASRNWFTENVVTQMQGPLASHAWLRGPNVDRYVSAAEWQNLNPQDRPPAQPVRFSPIITTLGPELVTDGNFNSGLRHWRTYQNPSSSGLSLQPFPTDPGCLSSGLCMGFSTGHPFDILLSTPFMLRSGVPHVYRWSAAMPASTGASVAPPFVGREASPWDFMSDNQGFVTYGPRQGSAGQTLDYEAFFVPKSSAVSRVNIQVETSRVQLRFGRISVREVTSYTSAKVPDWAVVANALGSTSRTFGCAELGWPATCTAIGLAGEAVPLPLTLPAGTMRPLFRADSPFRR
jgi:parallel beta-helix repeat protein